MKSRERLLTALAHKQPDRCPTYLWITTQAMQNVVRYLGASSNDEAERMMGIDGWKEVALATLYPDDYSQRIKTLVPSEYQGRSDLRVIPNGRVVRLHSGADYLEDVVWYPLGQAETPDDLDTYPFLQTDWIEGADSLAAEIARLKANDRFVYGLVDQAFKQAWMLRGMHSVLMDFLINPDLINAIYDRMYAFMSAYCARLVRAGVDMIQLIGDLGMQNTLFISPAVWRDFDKWRVRELIRELKGINPDLKLYMHTDGDVRQIIEDLIEVGIEVLNPIQPECMDPVQIKRQYGDRLTLHGAVSLQRTLPFGTPEEVKAEVRHLIENCNVDGGFVLGPSNVMFKEIPPENIVAMYQAVY